MDKTLPKTEYVKLISGDKIEFIIDKFIAEDSERLKYKIANYKGDSKVPDITLNNISG